MADHADELNVELDEPIDDGVREELALIYNKANDALLFVKAQQWWTVGSTLAVFAAFLVIAKFINAGAPIINKLTAMIILMSCASIFMLVVYQFWQHNELLRIQAVSRHFSPLFRKIQAIKSPKEGNFHRYTLLAFMIAMVVLGAAISYMGLDALPRWPR